MTQLTPRVSHRDLTRSTRGVMGSGLLRDQSLHSAIPDHEVGGRGVLIDQQGGCPGLERLHDARRLTRGTGRVRG